MKEGILGYQEGGRNNDQKNQQENVSNTHGSLRLEETSKVIDPRPGPSAEFLSSVFPPTKQSSSIRCGGGVGKRKALTPFRSHQCEKSSDLSLTYAPTVVLPSLPVLPLLLWQCPCKALHKMHALLLHRRQSPFASSLEKMTLCMNCLEACITPPPADQKCARRFMHRCQ